MVLRFSRAAWFMSMIGALTVLLFVYASLPDQVFLYQTGLKMNSLSREMVFYICLLILAMVNVMVFIFSAVYKDDDLKSWFNGLVVTLNIFFMIVFAFLNLSNSNEKYDYSRLGPLIYGSLILVILWAVSWPVILLFRKFLAKERV